MTRPSIPNSNPFATKHTRPGALDYIFSEDFRIGELIRRLHVGHRWQVVGPHGTGKTTLLKTLMQALEGADIRFFAFHDGHSNMQIDKLERARWDSKTLVIIDGFEQLRWLPRKILQIQNRKRQFKLLVTSHSDLGWPMLFQTRFDTSILRTVIHKLCPEFEQEFETQIQTAINNQNGNVREILFELYDVWNQKAKNGVTLR